MLLVKGRPVLNYRDFTDNFNMADILAKPETYAVFFERHLQYSDLHKRCIENFAAAARGQVWPVNEGTDIWRGCPPDICPEESARLRLFADELWLSCKRTLRRNRQKTFILWFSAAVLAGRLQAETDILRTPEQARDPGELVFKEGIPELTLAAGTYACRYDADFRMPEGAVLYTVKLNYAGNDDYGSRVKFGTKTENVKRGFPLYVTACGDTAVRLLPGTGRDGIFSLAEHNGDYICLDEKSGQPYSGRYTELSPELFRGGVRFVETEWKNGSFYLLTEKGEVKLCSGHIPGNMTGCYSSLAQAFREASV